MYLTRPFLLLIRRLWPRKSIHRTSRLAVCVALPGFRRPDGATSNWDIIAVNSDKRGVESGLWLVHLLAYYYAPAPRVGALSDDARLTSVCRVHRA